MIGLSNKIDWAKLTFEKRLLETGVPYRNFAGDWQTTIDRAIARYPRIYLQLPRGHDKTERFAWWSMLWLLTSNNHRGYACGVDRDNARLFRDASKKLKALHPELFSSIIVEKHTVLCKNTGSYIETISSDANSAYGLNFDLLIVNDFHAWPDKNFWEILWTACEKKPDIRIWMESNALTLGSEGAQWVADQRSFVKEIGCDGFKGEERDTEWWHYIPNQFLAKWQEKAIENWKSTLHPSTFRRLIQNEDCSDVESYLTPEQVEACERLDGPKNEADKGSRVVTAVDLGLKRDSTAVATVQLTRGSATEHAKSNPALKLLSLHILTGSVEEPVLLESVERLLLQLKTKYGGSFIADPWNMQGLMQKYSWIEEWIFTPKHVQELTQHLYRLINDKQLLLYKNAGEMYQSGKTIKGSIWNLKRELVNAVLKQTPYGERVDHRSGGFSDRLIAVGMACHHLLENGLIWNYEKPRQYKEDGLVGSKILEAIGVDKKSEGFLRF